MERRRSIVALVAAVVAGITALGGIALAIGPVVAGPGPADATDNRTPPPPPNGADFCYVQMMMPHHQQAVEMSAILLAKDGVSERAQRFAEFVSTDQSREIEAAAAWVEAWRDELAATPAADLEPLTIPEHHGPAQPEPTTTAEPIDVDTVVDCGDASDPGRFSTMSGMLSPAQLDELRAAPSPRAEILYLELMIPHHDGALDMSRDLLSDGSNTFALQMARHILNEQKKEIAAMRVMIEELS